MDKKYVRFERVGQELTIACEFVEDVSVKEKIKAYILEKQRCNLCMDMESQKERNGADLTVGASKEVF